MHKKILFVGLGGAGQRHLRILNKLDGKNFKFFCYRKKNKTGLLNDKLKLFKGDLVNKFKITKINNLKNTYSKNFDFAVISNPTKFHAETAYNYLKSGISVFIEKPLISSEKLFIKTVKILKKNKLVFYLGYQRRFSEIIIEVNNYLNKINVNQEVIKCNVNVNSYVPSWHNYENYRDLYACNKNLGGGALLTESHEIDLIIMFFGVPRELFCKKFTDKRYKLDVDTRYILKLYYENFEAIFNINMFNKNQKREINIKTTNSLIKIDLHKNSLTVKDKNKIKDKKFSNNKNNDQFINQMKYFLKLKYKDNTINVLNAYQNNLILNAAIKSDRLNKRIKIYPKKIF